MSRVIWFALVALVVTADACAAAATTKRWATDLPGFLSEHPGRWVVGESDQPALSAEEAERLARRAAARAIAPEVSARLSRPVDRPRVAAGVEALLGGSETYVVDRSVEARERPYGTIWRAALLVDASPAKLDTLARQIDRQARREHARGVAGTFAICALAAVVGTFYAFANWLTRGFFRGRLATGSVLAAAAGAAVVMNLL